MCIRNPRANLAPFIYSLLGHLKDIKLSKMTSSRPYCKTTSVVTVKHMALHIAPIVDKGKRKKQMKIKALSVK
jgi:hypothetical protein